MQTRAITFATGNEHKLEEARAQLGELGFTVEQYADGYPELQADTLQAVARHGLEHLAGHLEEPFLLEDAGLFVDALEGFPGVYSSHAFATIGNRGILDLLANKQDRGARFCSVVGLRYAGNDHLFLGEVEGRITESQRGQAGFGFDPIFLPEGEDETFAQMPQAKKIEVSHRSLALAKLQAHLEAYAEADD